VHLPRGTIGLLHFHVKRFFASSIICT